MCDNLNVGMAARNMKAFVGGGEGRGPPWWRQLLARQKHSRLPPSGRLRAVVEERGGSERDKEHCMAEGYMKLEEEC
jgi:hypothetical protein